MKTFFSLGFLLLVTLVVSLGMGTDARGSYTINAVRIYVNPDMVAPTEDGTPALFDGARTTLISGMLPEVADFSEGTLSIEDGGVEITATNAHDSTTPHTAKAGDIIAIAFKVTRNGSDVRHGSVISLSGWDTGGPHRTVYEPWTMTTYTKILSPSRFIEASRNTKVDVTSPYSFTVVYAYRVKSGDTDENGSWLHLRDNDKPFQRWVGATSATYTGTIYYPKIYAVSPTIVDATFGPEGSSPPGSSMDPTYDQDLVMLTSPYEFVSRAPHQATSLAAAVHEVCTGIDLNTYKGNPTNNTWLQQFQIGDPMPVAACLDADGFARGPMVDGLSPELTGFYGVGDTLEVSVEFTEPVVAHPDVVMILTFSGQARYARLSRGTESIDNKLYFGYTVQEGDGAFGSGISTFWPFAARGEDPNDPFGGPGHTPHPAAPGENHIQHHETTYAIQNEAGNPFTQLNTNSRGRDGANEAVSFRNFAAHTKKNWHGGLNHQVDGIRPSVALAKVDEGTDVTGPFTVDIKFYNVMFAPDPPSAPERTLDIADEVADIDADDIRFTDASGNVQEGWTVSTPEFIGYSYVPITRVPRFGVGHPQSKVYRVTLAPPLNFKGDVDIQVPEAVTMDIARNKNLASNTLTVSVDNPLRVVETPAIVAPPAGAYTAGDKIEVEVTYDRENLRYEGENPPYLTLYLGEEVPANARHAVWTAQEDANSTKVTFAYTVAATDVATSLRVAETIGLTVPRGTRLVDDTGSQLSGTGERAKGSGEGLEKLPTAAQLLPLEDTSGREVSPVVSDTPVVPYTPILEESEPKAAATEVPRSPVVFNELGNGSGDADDWLELRNVTGAAVSLKAWELSVVQDGKQEDTSLIVFPDASVPANGLLLITNSDPTAQGNVLAGGDNLATAEVEKKGSPHLYLVNAGLSLPDDGKFLLILRNAKEKLGLNAAFVDVAGGGGSDTDAFVREQTGLYDTHVWPLQVLQAPGGDTEDALGSGKVWQRAKADIVGYHKDAWAESAFTGIGYDRKVSDSASTAGTPGYPNGAVKPGTATPKGSVTLSEIMFDSGGGTLPQWIELYNNSKTDAINLNRWQLELQNVDSEDLVGRPIVTLTLGEKVIQPNQTLLIVAGPARASSDSYLPADRVYDLLALHEKNLRIKRARDTFLSTEGFYLKLTDRNENLVDEVGNRDSDRRSDDAPAWALPLSVEEGSRSSVIRRYDNGVALPGQKRASWVLAARLKPFDESLHYGHAEDIGTPGHREGGALPVELSNFSMTRHETGAVVLTWTTESEVDNAGFNLRRSEKRASGFTRLNPALIAGAGTTGERQTYAFTDTSAKPGVEYYYQIEEVSLGGKPETLVTRLLPGPVSAANRMLTTFGAVKRQK